MLHGQQEGLGKWKGLILLTLLIAIVAFVLAIIGVQYEVQDMQGRLTKDIDYVDETSTKGDEDLQRQINNFRDDVDKAVEISDDLKEKIEDGNVVTGVTRSEMQVANVQLLEDVDDKVAAVQANLDAVKVGSLNHNQIHIAMAVHAHPDDKFWDDLVKPGFDQAVSDMHVFGNFIHLHGQNQNEDWDLMGADIASQAYKMVDGVITSIPDLTHDGLIDGIKTALDEPVPVVSINSGLTGYHDIEKGGRYIRTHIGQDEQYAGRVAGEKMARLGVTNARCVIQEANNEALHDRCEYFCRGLKAEGGQSLECEHMVKLWKEGNVEPEIIELLEGDWSEVDGIMALGPQVSDHIASALRMTAKVDDVTFATFDHTDHVLELIEKGTMAFAVDQCPYSQGYLPVAFQALNAEIGTMMGALGAGPGLPIYSGPTIITKEIAAAKRFQNFADMSTATKQRKDIFISFITHGLGSRESFWTTVMKGARQAGLDLGIGRVEFHHPARALNYQNDFSMAEFEKMFDRDKGNADGLAICPTTPEVAEYIKQTCQINNKPCVTLNSGMFDGLSNGAFTHFGMEEFTAGAMAAQKFIDLGFTKFYCIMYDDTNSGIVQRCAGATAMFNCQDASSFEYDDYDDDRKEWLTCPDDEDRSGYTSETVVMLEANKACANPRDQWVCTDKTEGIATQDANLDCGLDAECCQCEDSEGNERIVFTTEQFPSALYRWYADEGLDGDAAILATGGSMDKIIQDGLGDEELSMAAFDCSARALNYIINGDMLFCVDQQPFLQGYMPVVFLTNAIQWGERAGAGKPAMTGPAIVTAAEAPQVMFYAEQGYR